MLLQHEGMVSDCRGDKTSSEKKGMAGLTWFNIWEKKLIADSTEN